MTRKLQAKDLLVFLIITLLLVITLTGILSLDNSQSYIITNQYGHQVEIFGHGIYSHDSFFRAPIFIGTDFTMFFLVVPMLLIGLYREARTRTIRTKLFMNAVLTVVLYYSASIAFGVTYNSYHLLYIALLSSSLFALIVNLRELETKMTLNKKINYSDDVSSRGIEVFLVISGVSLFIAWLPDILPTLINQGTLPLIEIYTTEITYVLDMGIISPLMFICLYLLKKRHSLGTILLASLLTLCAVMGIMLPIQTFFQILAGISIPLPVLVVKVGIFVVLALFATYFDVRLFKKIRSKENESN